MALDLGTKGIFTEPLPAIELYTTQHSALYYENKMRECVR
mgnify:CR=1 FL=1